MLWSGAVCQKNCKVRNPGLFFYRRRLFKPEHGLERKYQHLEQPPLQKVCAPK